MLSLQHQLSGGNRLPLVRLQLRKEIGDAVMHEVNKGLRP